VITSEGGQTLDEIEPVKRMCGGIRRVGGSGIEGETNPERNAGGGPDIQKDFKND